MALLLGLLWAGEALSESQVWAGEALSCYDWTYDVNEKDSQGNSPLLLACRSEMNVEIAEILVGAGANVSAANERGDTPLLAAIGAGRFEMVESQMSKQYVAMVHRL